MNQVRIISAENVKGKQIYGIKEFRKNADLYINYLDPIIKKDENYAVLTLKNIKLAVLRYAASKDMIESFQASIKRAKDEGAEFFLAFASCKMKDEETCMKAVADAGADYIIGFGKKQMRPYSILHAADGRQVPVYYGNGKLTEDTFEAVIAELHLEKNQDGLVVVTKELCHPCVMDTLEDDDEEEVYSAFMVNRALEKKDVNLHIKMEETLLRIKGALGIQAPLYYGETLGKAFYDAAKGCHSELQKDYEVRPILTAPKKQTAMLSEEGYGYQYDAVADCYIRPQDTAEREAAIICTGHIEYGKNLEVAGECLGQYNFLRHFKYISNHLKNADLVLGNLVSMASIEYPSLTEVSLNTRKEGYCNCRGEFIEALKQAGFTGLALSNSYNACLGAQGIFDTAELVTVNQMLPFGIGMNKNKVVEINGIKVGLISITTQCINGRNILTGEAIDKLLNIFDQKRTEKEIKQIKEAGAEFVITYINCGVNTRLLSLEERKSIAETVAEMGADYVICTGPRVISDYYKFKTKDEREVPVATSIGCFLTGWSEQSCYESVILKIYLRRDFNGNILVEDRFVPIEIHENANSVKHVVLPSENKSIAKSLGADIKLESFRTIDVHKTYTRTLTIKEIYEILDKKPSEEDLRRLGEKYFEPVSCVSIRRRFMKENGVAVMYKFDDFVGNLPIEWDINLCIDAGISLVIDNEPHAELPCIVVDEPLIGVFEKLSKAVRDLYDPFTVGITGSMGKTTTKEIMTKVFETHFKTVSATGNTNAIYQIGNLLQSFEDDDEAYIQEVHGGTEGTAACVSRVISPDVCVVTNIVENHIEQIGSIENLVKNKLRIIDGMKPDGVLILCDDNPYLKTVAPPVKTIRYSSENVNVDYYAKNIQETESGLRFDIVCNATEFDESAVYPAVLNIRGRHNVNNALAAFAAGRRAGIPAHEIIAGLSRYRTQGIRQNIVEHNGIKLLLDTYNSNPKALSAMMDVFDSLQPQEGGKKVLVLGMMGEQGEDSPHIHFEAGKKLCNHDFDLMLCYGEDAKQTVIAAREEGREAYYFDDRTVLNRMLREQIHPGDVVLVKGSHSMKLDKETLVPIFGLGIQKH